MDTQTRQFGDADSAVDQLPTLDDYELASRILDAMLSRSAQDFSPSQIAKLAGVHGTCAQVRRVLPALVEDTHLVKVGRGGAWARYRAVWG